MNLKTNEEIAHGKLVDQSDAIDMIAKELTWLLTEAQKQDPQLGSPLADELGRRFMALYKDFQGIRENGMKLSMELEKMEFDDHILGLIYKTSGRLLVRKMSEGLFEQFISVAEFGVLPEDLEDENG